MTDTDLLANLFIRVGFFVSNADDTDDTKHSENMEIKNLRLALGRVGAIAKHQVVAKAAAKALAISAAPRPETKDTLAIDIKRAVSLFKEDADIPGLKEFHKALMYVGTMVARAYREELDHHEDEFMLESLLNKLSGQMNEDVDPQEFKNANVSPLEEAALNIVSKALKA